MTGSVIVISYNRVILNILEGYYGQRKIDRVLGIYTKLMSGCLVNKTKEAQDYEVMFHIMEQPGSIFLQGIDISPL